MKLIGTDGQTGGQTDGNEQADALIKKQTNVVWTNDLLKMD